MVAGAILLTEQVGSKRLTKALVTNRDGSIPVCAKKGCWIRSEKKALRLNDKLSGICIMKGELKYYEY
jgi:hypothetical protein